MSAISRNLEYLFPSCGGVPKGWGGSNKEENLVHPVIQCWDNGNIFYTLSSRSRDNGDIFYTLSSQCYGTGIQEKEKNMDINSIRENIDKIDQQILKLLDDRMQQAVMIRKFKEKTEDKTREQEVLKKVSAIANSNYPLLAPAFVEKLYKIIIEESKRIQDNL